MVKRCQIVPGLKITVTKQIGVPPGPDCYRVVETNEVLTVLSPPRTSGGMNLVRVQPERGDVFNALYAWVTCNCKELK